MNRELLSRYGDIRSTWMSQLQKRSIEGNGAGGPEARRAACEQGLGGSADAAEAVSEQELIERAPRRRFSSAYKLRILREAGGLSPPARSARYCAGSSPLKVVSITSRTQRARQIARISASTALRARRVRPRATGLDLGEPPAGFGEGLIETPGLGGVQGGRMGDNRPGG